MPFWRLGWLTFIVAADGLILILRPHSWASTPVVAVRARGLSLTVITK